MSRAVSFVLGIISRPGLTAIAWKGGNGGTRHGIREEEAERECERNKKVVGNGLLEVITRVSYLLSTASYSQTHFLSD